ncbi:MAG: hypothetical protein ABI877_09190 [Gemmatimonadaceae bacterium]
MRYYVSALAAVAGITLSTSLDAQCIVPKESNEAKLLAYYAAPLAFSPSGTLGVMKAGAIRLGFEVTLIPAPGDELRRTNICFLPKQENSQLSPVFPRPHLAVGLGGGFFAEAMYLPPVTVMDATPNMGSVALGYARALSAKTGFALRGHATFGEVKGPITCNKDALQDNNENSACYGDEISDDTYKPNILGAEAALTFQPSERLSGYLGAGFASLKPRFQVGFQPEGKPFDSTRVVVDLKRFSLEFGGAFHLSHRIALTAELYSVPKDMTTVRFGGTWNVR